MVLHVDPKLSRNDFFENISYVTKNSNVERKRFIVSGKNNRCLVESRILKTPINHVKPGRLCKGERIVDRSGEGKCFRRMSQGEKKGFQKEK